MFAEYLWVSVTYTFSLSCIGEGNGHPLQCSCLENPRDGGAWWAAVYGVAQSRTLLKRLSSSTYNPHVLLPRSLGGNNHIKKQNISLDSVARRFINLHIGGKQIGLTVTDLKQWKSHD